MADVPLNDWASFEDAGSRTLDDFEKRCAAGSSYTVVDANGAAIGPLLGVEGNAPWVLLPSGIVAHALLANNVLYYSGPGCRGTVYSLQHDAP